MTKKIILSLVFSSLLLPYTTPMLAESAKPIAEKCSQNINQFFTRFFNFANAERKKATYHMPGFIRNALYAGMATTIVTLMWHKPINKILDKIGLGNSNNEEISGKLHFELIKNLNLDRSDLAGQKFTPEIEEIVDNAGLKKAGTGEIILPKYPLLLHGPTKTGKSHTAKVLSCVLAKKLGKQPVILKTAGSYFLNKYVGETPKKIREIAKKAGTYTAKRNIIKKLFLKGLKRLGKSSKENFSFIIIDELDSLFTGRKGNQDFGHAAAEAFQDAVETYLTDQKDKLLIATLNFTNIPAAVISRMSPIYVALPNQNQREKIIEHYTKKSSKDFLNIVYESKEESCSRKLRKAFKIINNKMKNRSPYYSIISKIKSLFNKSNHKKTYYTETKDDIRFRKHLAKRTKGWNYNDLIKLCEGAHTNALRENKRSANLNHFLSKATKLIKEKAKIKISNPEYTGKKPFNSTYKSRQNSYKDFSAIKRLGRKHRMNNLSKKTPMKASEDLSGHLLSYNEIDHPLSPKKIRAERLRKFVFGSRPRNIENTEEINIEEKPRTKRRNSFRAKKELLTRSNRSNSLTINQTKRKKIALSS